MSAIAGLDEAGVTAFLHGFYARVRRDPLTGPFYNEQVEDWDQFLDAMTRFWGGVLLRDEIDPTVVPPFLRFTLTRELLARWTQIWNAAANDRFDPDTAREVGAAAERLIGQEPSLTPRR